jgi:hypothetical protein
MGHFHQMCSNHQMCIILCAFDMLQSSDVLHMHVLKEKKPSQDLNAVNFLLIMYFFRKYLTCTCFSSSSWNVFTLHAYLHTHPNIISTHTLPALPVFQLKKSSFHSFAWEKCIVMFLIHSVCNFIPSSSFVLRRHVVCNFKPSRYRVRKQN